MCPTNSREVQRHIVADLQRAYARTSQGRELAVKEWADENQNRGILCLRLRCKKAKCKIQLGKYQQFWSNTARHVSSCNSDTCNHGSFNPMVVTDSDQAEAELLVTDREEWSPPELSTSSAAVPSAELSPIVPPHLALYDEEALAQQQQWHSPLIPSIVVPPLPPVSAPAAAMQQQYSQFHHRGQGEPNSSMPSHINSGRTNTGTNN